jgi:hypothetical protein
LAQMAPNRPGVAEEGPEAEAEEATGPTLPDTLAMQPEPANAAGAGAGVVGGAL